MPASETENSVMVFDRLALRRQRERATRGFTEHDFLFREVAARLVDRLTEIKRDFNIAINLGARGEHLNRLLSDNPSIETVLGMGLTPGGTGVSFVGDEEALPIAPTSANLVISNLVLHWTNDLPGALIQCRQTLKPDGLFLAAILGTNTNRITAGDHRVRTRNFWWRFSSYITFCRARRCGFDTAESWVQFAGCR